MTKPISCLVVDDEPLAVELIEQYIQKVPQLACVGSCWNALEAFEILKQQQVDLIFLDIQMPELSGIEFVKSLPSPPSIIFTTAYRDYAVESYELDVVDYLLKPITFSRFFKSVNKFLAKWESHLGEVSTLVVPAPTPSFLFVNSQRKQVKVALDEVLYVESIKDYVYIHLPHKSVQTKDTITEFEQKLPPFFLRVHRSFILNTRKISAFNAHDIELEGKEIQIPIGISYKKEVMAFLEGLG
ncbi:MAG: LytTR family DNA-binding domain-containing protein [Bacteroidota bacterium]